jgi:hypothetical protein
MWALRGRELLRASFSLFSRGLPGMSQNVLARLRELEQPIVRRRRPAARRAHVRTDRTRTDLEPVLVAMATWGSRLPITSTGELSVDALILALKTTFDPHAAAGLRARYELRLGDDLFHAEIDDGRFQIARGAADDADATLATAAATLRALVFGGRTLTDAVRRGDAHVGGGRRLVARFARCFPRPTARPTPAS